MQRIQLLSNLFIYFVYVFRAAPPLHLLLTIPLTPNWEYEKLSHFALFLLRVLSISSHDSEIFSISSRFADVLK